MTREEAINELTTHLMHWKRLLSDKICSQEDGERTINALEVAIKALKKEPCEDYISNKAESESEK